MPSLERIAGFAVIEIVFGSGPADNPEVLAEVLGVAAGAVQVSLCPVEDFAVIAAVLCHQVPDFPVARLAVEFRRARPKAVAARAFDRTVDRLVRLGERSGRYLRRTRRGWERQTTRKMPRSAAVRIAVSVKRRDCATMVPNPPPGERIGAYATSEIPEECVRRVRRFRFVGRRSLQRAGSTETQYRADLCRRRRIRRPQLLRRHAGQDAEPRPSGAAAGCGSPTRTPPPPPARRRATRLLTGEYAWRKKGTGILPGDAPLIIRPARATMPLRSQEPGLPDRRGRQVASGPGGG